MKFIAALLLYIISLSSFASYTYDVTLKSLGVTEGITSKQQLTKKSVYINLPRVSLIESVELTIESKLAPILRKSSYIRVSGNNRVIGYIETKDSGTVKFKLDTEIFSSSRDLELKFDLYSDLVGDVECAPLSFYEDLIQIYNSSKLQVRLNERPKTVNDYLLTLPKNFSVTIPKRELSEKEFLFLAKLKKFTREIGKKMRLTKMREFSDIVLGTSEEIKSFIDDKTRDIIAFDYSPVMRTFHTKQIKTLGINSSNEEFEVQDIFPFVNGFNSGKVISLKQLRINNPSKSMKFQRVSDSEFSLSYSNQDLTNSKIIKRLNLSVSASSKFTGENLILNVYKNENLVKTIELSDSEDPQFYSLEIPQVIDRMTDTITLRTFSQGKGEVCSKGSRFEFNVLPDTTVELSDPKLNRAVFVDFIRGLNSGGDLFLPKSALSVPSFWLDYLDLFLKSSDLNYQKLKIQFYDQLPDVISKGTVLFTSELYDDVEGPHRLNPAELNVNFVEIAELNKEKLLHIHVVNKDKVKLNFIEFGRRDLSYFDSERTLYTINSREEQDFTSSYSNRNQAEVFFNKYKMIIFLILWLFLTFLFIRFMKRKKKS